MARIITVKQQVAELKHHLKDRQKTRGETFFNHHRNKDGLMWGNNEELTEQMKIWRKQRKDGIIKIMDYNNHTKMIQGQEWHILVVQDVEEWHNSIDPVGLGFDDGAFLVSGLIYCFKRIENRDATYKYVMGLK
jgi:hypothetical protein